MSLRYGISYGSHPLQVMDYFPARGTASATIVFWHGGGWRSGDKRAYRPVARALSAMNFNVYLPNYRLYPEVKFPVFIEDGAQVLKWIQEHHNPEGVIVAGHSAGAYIAAMLAIDNTYTEHSSVSPSIIKGLLGISGPYDFRPGSKYQAVFQDSPRSVWNPINRITGETVPLLLFQGSHDKIVLPSNTQSLSRTAQSMGSKIQSIIFPLGHFGILLLFLPVFCNFFKTKDKIYSFFELTDTP